MIIINRFLHVLCSLSYEAGHWNTSLLNVRPLCGPPVKAFALPLNLDAAKFYHWGALTGLDGAAVWALGPADDDTLWLYFLFMFDKFLSALSKACAWLFAGLRCDDVSPVLTRPSALPPKDTAFSYCKEEGGGKRCLGLNRVDTFTCNFSTWSLHMVKHFAFSAFFHSQRLCNNSLQWVFFTLSPHCQMKICSHRLMQPLTHIPYHTSGISNDYMPLSSNLSLLALKYHSFQNLFVILAESGVLH